MATRIAVEEGDSQQAQACASRMTQMNVKDFVSGARSLESCADEQSSLVGTLCSRPSMSNCYPSVTITSARLLHMDRDARPKWQLEEADDQLKQLRQHLDCKLTKCSILQRRKLGRHVALALATEATLEDDSVTALGKVKQGINLTWLDHPMVWLLILQILRRLLEKQGQREIADAIGKFLFRRPRMRRTEGDFILAPALWGLEAPGQIENSEENPT